MQEQVLKLRTARPGPFHHDTVGAKNNLAFSRILQGKVAEAEILLSEDLPSVRAICPPTIRCLEVGCTTWRSHYY